MHEFYQIVIYASKSCDCSLKFQIPKLEGIDYIHECVEIPNTVIPSSLSIDLVTMVLIRRDVSIASIVNFS